MKDDILESVSHRSVEKQQTTKDCAEKIWENEIFSLTLHGRTITYYNMPVRQSHKKENTTSIGFEETIWRAADKLRGNLNASEYEGVVLGLIFLKYISDKFEVKFKELSEDEYADVEDKDEYEADGVFFVPQEG